DARVGGAEHAGEVRHHHAGLRDEPREVARSTHPFLRAPLTYSSVARGAFEGRVRRTEPMLEALSAAVVVSDVTRAWCAHDSPPPRCPAAPLRRAEWSVNCLFDQRRGRLLASVRRAPRRLAS